MTQCAEIIAGVAGRRGPRPGPGLAGLSLPPVSESPWPWHGHSIMIETQRCRRTVQVGLGAGPLESLLPVANVHWIPSLRLASR